MVSIDPVHNLWYNGSTTEFPQRTTGVTRVSFNNGRLRYQQTQTGNMGRITPALGVNLSADMTIEAGTSVWVVCDGAGVHHRKSDRGAASRADLHPR